MQPALTGHIIHQEFGEEPMDNTRFNWGLALLGAFLATLVGAGSALAMNYRDWHPEAFTGWTLYGFLLLGVGIVILAIVFWLAITTDALWPTPTAFVLGVAVGVGAVFYFQNTSVQWTDALLGLVCFGGLTGLVIAIGYLSGRSAD